MAAKLLQSMYGQLLDALDAKSITGYLFGTELITRDVKQQIGSSTTKDGNEILLDHLYDTATKESLADFAAIILSDKVCSKKVQQLGKDLQQKLRRLKEGSSVATGTGQPEDSEENEKLDKSSPDTGHHPPSNSSETKSSDDESDTESEQEEASDFDPDYVPKSDSQAGVEATPCEPKKIGPGARKLFKAVAKRPRIADSESDDDDDDDGDGNDHESSDDQDDICIRIEKIRFHAEKLLAECEALASRQKDHKPPMAWSTEARKVLHELMEQPFAKPFIEPVDLEQYPDYTDYIVHPLCLSDIEKKMRNGAYQTGGAFFEDFKQIVANSRIYNTDMSSEIVKCTTAFEQYVKEREKLFQHATARLPRQLRRHK